MGDPHRKLFVEILGAAQNMTSVGAFGGVQQGTTNQGNKVDTGNKERLTHVFRDLSVRPSVAPCSRYVTPSHFRRFRRA